ncbi:hypothetical protein [Williamsia sp. DF01-3]|uniref:hypothetical protein n=1 Tax=Williamsia sp. DF01-3 TaxID=2934157 RepID=UPI001FF36B77|nr:hypothetical protein [Williamsia sp. DF01-3]MCK0517350.1 hypothetical protein [Williamsia sp. DF01-3]
MLKSGARLRSQVCSTEVIVVRAGSVDLTLTCGGHLMIALGDDPDTGLVLDGGFASGAAIGKRYTDGSGSAEILVTKAGAGTLAIGGIPLQLKATTPLPSSD